MSDWSWWPVLKLPFWHWTLVIDLTPVDTLLGYVAPALAVVAGLSAYFLFMRYSTSVRSK
jgi:hypothetical protein